MQMLEAKEISAPSEIGKSSHPKLSRKPALRKIEKEIVYPDRDGKPMSDNTKQFDWIVKVKENLERIFADNPDVFVAGDLLWYPKEGNNKIRTAPDAMVVFGRPKGHRGSYMMWKENHVTPQVVFEILSPGNTWREREEKFGFYETYGVSEYYEYDPDRIVLKGWIRRENSLRPIEDMRGWTSPLLKIRFEPAKNDLRIFGPDGAEFLSRVEAERLHQKEIRKAISKAESEQKKASKAAKEAESERKKAVRAARDAESERKKALLAEKKAESERNKTLRAEKKAEQERQRADSEHLRAERLAAKLKELGIEISE